MRAAAAGAVAAKFGVDWGWAGEFQVLAVQVMHERSATAILGNMVTGTPSELNVRSEAIQRIYNLYRSDHFQVNRRYQRKLVWNVEEKRRLIDSAINQLPIPLILVAEKVDKSASGATFELIDGLQRMNAIIAYIENEFSVDGEYFDLTTLADTKELLDAGRLTQRTPILDRSTSTRFANYNLALSVFRAPNDESVDEVFRRINSSGRKLSTQDLRQAGTTSLLAERVRTIAAQIRTDSSPTNLVPLRAMPKLSISNVQLAYGISVDDIFWVRQGVLNREDVRSSLDEELVLDLLVDISIHPLPNTSTKSRNRFFNFSAGGGAGEKTRQSAEIENTLRIEGAAIEARFFHVYDVVRQLIEADGRRFCDLIGIGSRNSIPRYFHAAFMAIYRLHYSDNKEISDLQKAARCIDGKHQQFHIQKGGEWTADKKSDAFNQVKALIEPASVTSGTGNDLATGRASFFEKLLSNCLVEQGSFEIKQGAISLDAASSDISDGLIKKIARTATAIANRGPGSVGYLVLGVADSDEAAARILAKYGSSLVSFRGFNVVGLERESARIGISMSEYWDRIVRKLSTAPGIDEEFGRELGGAAILSAYHGLAVGTFAIQSGARPYFFNNELVDRVGSETVVVPNRDYPSIFARFA